MTTLVVNAVADRDVDEIFLYFHGFYGADAAAAFNGRLDALVNRLMAYPESGAPRPALGSDVRIGIVRPYILIYRYERAIDTVEMLRLLHGHRNIDIDAVPR